MAGRRLTISALLCADEQPMDVPPLPPTDSGSPPSTPFISPTPGPATAPDDLGDIQVHSAGPVEFRHDAFRSRPYPDYSRDSHNTVPLSSQPEHLRRLTPSPSPGVGAIVHGNPEETRRESAFDRPETLASTSRPLSSLSRGSDSASYHIPYPPPQTAPRPIPTPRRTSDPREGGFRTSESASYISRLPSTRSAHLDPLLASYSYPPPLPSSSYPLSPQQPFSNLFKAEPNHHPSHSPALGRPLSRSPTYFYRPMSQSTSHSEAQQSPYPQGYFNPSQSPPVLPASGSPSAQDEEPLSARPSRFRSASYNQAGSPPTGISRTSSATALPNLLNTEPPRSPTVPFGSHGSPGGLGALEALVQAATEERRRLSGELPTPLEKRESARRASLSPVLSRVPPLLPRPSQSPVLQKSPPLPSPRLDTRVNSLAFISLGQPSSQDGEPPTKRRRRTGSFGSGSSLLQGVGSSTIAIPEPPRVASPVATSVVAPAAPVPPETATVLGPTPGHIATSVYNSKPEYEPVTLSDPMPISEPTPVPKPEAVPEPASRPEPASDPESMPAAVPPPLDDEAPVVEPVTAPDPVLGSEPASVSYSYAVPEPVAVPDAAPAPPLSFASSPDSAAPGAVAGSVPSFADKPAPPTTPIHDNSTTLLPALPPAPQSPLPPTSVPTSSKPRSISQLLVQNPSPEHGPRVDHEYTPQIGDSPSESRMSPLPVAMAAEKEPRDPEEGSTNHSSDSTQRMYTAPAEVEVPMDEVVKTEEVVDTPLVTAEVKQPPPELGLPDGPIPEHHEAELPAEQDAHEWLLDHYATDSPADASLRPSPAPEAPPDSPTSSIGDLLPEVIPEGGQKAATSTSGSADVQGRRRKPWGPSRTPTPLALLEEELDRVTPDDRMVTSNAASPNSDTDLAMELDLAASATDQAMAESVVATNTEIDDELLSLLDDRPRHSHSHSHPHSHSHVHSHSRVHTQRSPPRPNLANTSHGSSSSARPEKPLQVKEDPALKPSEPLALPARPSATPAPSERLIMPPPIAPPGQAAKAAASSAQQPAGTKSQKFEGAAATSSQKKEASAKPAQKAKPSTKAKAKTASTKSKAKGSKDGAAESSGRVTPSGSGPTTKGKKTTVAASAAASVAKRSVSAVGQSRSRSASVMPAPPEPTPKPQEEPEEEEEEVVDDKLYCVCKTHYDEDKVMIACDRCDEWYHTQCLKMDDLEVDLIDQFVCPPCIKANPHLPLKTTYKQRCYAGLKHPRPKSAAACHKPARGAFSKFCSDECGIAYMQRRIDGWGGDQAVLWASVRDVKQREGVVVKVHVMDEELKRAAKPDQRTGQLVMETHEVQKPMKTQRERAIARLQGELLKIAPKREILKQELEVVLWRQKLLALAAARAERVRECGWDQRLCFDDEEYADYAAGVLESYEEGHVNGGSDAMHIDGTGVEDGAWWCRGNKKCQRHAGWQKLRASEFEFDQELKEKAMAALTTREREIRRQLEDVISLDTRKVTVPSAPLQPINGRAQANGVAKPKANGTRKGKQKN